MSVIIKKIQNTNESNAKTNGKWYPRVVNIGTMNLDALCEHIQEQLLESRKVKLDGLGTFYLKARLKVGNGEEGQAIYGGVSDEKDLLVQNVDFQVGFQPDMSDTSRFVGPNISRKAARKSISALGLTESEDEEEETTNSGSNSGGTNSGGTNSGNSGDEPGEDRP